MLYQNLYGVKTISYMRYERENIFFSFYSIFINNIKSLGIKIAFPLEKLRAFITILLILNYVKFCRAGISYGKN